MPLQLIETTRGLLEYSVSSSFGYRFSVYLVLPRITECDEFKSGHPFPLSPIIQAISNEYLTLEEQQATYLKKNGKPEKVIDAVRWYVRFVGKEKNIIEVVERGLYQMPSGEQVVDDDVIEEEIAEEAGLTTEGFIYAFSFPELVRNEPFPIKIGMTIRDVEERVADQCKGTAIFSQPKILKSWPVQKVSLTERTVHGLLKLSGQWKSDAPGAEWFVTTLAEIERIVEIVQRETH
jgi:T5orf172 domain